MCLLPTATRKARRALPRNWLSITSPEFTGQPGVDIRSRESIRKVLGEAALAFGGIDILINTAAIFPSTPDGEIPDEMWADTLACERDRELSACRRSGEAV